MEDPVKEQDWKYLRSIREEMLYALCSRISRKAASIATAKTKDPHKQYIQLCRYIKRSDAIVAECFHVRLHLSLYFRPEVKC